MIVLYAGVMAAVFLADILIKQSVEEKVSVREERRILNGRILVRKVYNKGMMLSFMKRYPRVVKWSSVVLGVFIFIYDAILLCMKGRHLQKLGMMLLTGGAWSNILDRVMRGKVIDYFGFQTKWKAFTRITFNLGDLCIFAGAAFSVIGRLLRK